MLAKLPAPPACDILGGFWGAPERTNPEDEAFDDITDLVELWKVAAGNGDLAECAMLAAASAQRCSQRRSDARDPTSELARALGALGHVRAHTGSARGLIFPRGAMPAKAPDLMSAAGLHLCFTRGRRAMSGFAAAMLVGLILDALLGWPTRLYARIGHPVTWLGRLITGLEQALNRGSHAQRLFGGAVCVIAALAATVGPAIWLQAVLPSGWAGLLLTGALAWPLIAARSMHDHVAAVAAWPQTHCRGTTGGGNDRRARDEALSSAGVARRAGKPRRNTSDGIVAPIFWGVVAGLPGIVAYKTINTLDSMIGYRTERYDAFGKVAARPTIWST